MFIKTLYTLHFKNIEESSPSPALYCIYNLFKKYDVCIHQVHRINISYVRSYSSRSFVVSLEFESISLFRLLVCPYLFRGTPPQVHCLCLALAFPNKGPFQITITFKSFFFENEQQTVLDDYNIKLT